MFRIPNIWILGFVGQTYKTEANLFIEFIENGSLPSKDFSSISSKART